ncbi:putative late blight resistance protein homolog R1A-3 [Lycium ferocissimum]|uniref:putative late blight resistance protein homolog R1A-3 n=1 Tax=Lycium ferocissimum TaxID=112874 RepID=UPI002815257C|nr:putative late blight resistance protein homolog R1A-3 [Lycium ferocissimum]
MAETVVNFLLQNLLQVISDYTKLIEGADDDFTHLIGEVRSLKGFLSDEANDHSNSDNWNQLVKDIRVTVNKAEDIIDKFMVQAKLHRDKNKVARFFDANHKMKVASLAKDIQYVLKRVQEIRRNNKQALQPRRTLTQPARPEQVPQDYSLADKVVGFDEEARKVIQRLVKGTEQLDVVPVFGMAGLGKTTLAKMIYNDDKIAHEFYIKIWVYVGQEYKIKDILINNILKVFMKNIEEHKNKNVTELTQVICDFVAKGGKVLIVLDDVWEVEVVDYFKKVFPENNGHRIMMTTREKRVANYANEKPHFLKFLLPDESFKLLKIRVFGDENCPVEFVSLGISIANQCSGVPLAVVVIAGALKGCTEKYDWERVEKSVGEHLINTDKPDDSCLKFVKMSYDRLLPAMKPCFLYCGVFPRGFEIPAWKLIRLWIAEGLVQSNSKFTAEEIAKHYLDELVNRSLVILVLKKSDGQIKTCRVHDMLHQFCRKEAISENLFQELCLTKDGVVPTIKDPETFRRLSIQSSILNNFLSTRQSADHVRSLLCFPSEQQQTTLSTPGIKFIPEAFELIRVLEIESIKFQPFAKFYELFHLRYVAMSGDFDVLPAAFGKFWNLQTVIFKTSKSTLEIKADIWNMSRLRHLHTNIPAKLQPPNSSTTTSKGSCLQTLSVVEPESCKKDVLANGGNLKKLSIQGRLALLEAIGGFRNLEVLKCLEHLKLKNRYTSDLHLPPIFFAVRRRLKKLSLSNTRFEWSEASRLGQLELLEELKLKENAFKGDSWKTEGGFENLQILIIKRADFEIWEASDRSFPNLKHLVLVTCRNLKAVPHQLANVQSLREMHLQHTSGAVKSARDIESEITSLRTTKSSINFTLTVFPPETTQ